MKPRSKTPQKTLTHQAAVKELLADPWGVLVAGADHEVLAGFEPQEREAIIAEVKYEWQVRREAMRRPILRERLATWPVEAWGGVFCEMPELENELTPEQKAQWRAWLAEREEK